MFLPEASSLTAAAPALGIAAASFASQPSLECGNGNEDYEKGLVAGRTHSEQRYSGKPDGKAGTHRKKSENLKNLKTTPYYYRD